jgi:hypothetical protein
MIAIDTFLLFVINKPVNQSLTLVYINSPPAPIEDLARSNLDQPVHINKCAFTLPTSPRLYHQTWTRTHVSNAGRRPPNLPMV